MQNILNKLGQVRKKNNVTTKGPLKTLTITGKIKWSQGDSNS